MILRKRDRVIRLHEISRRNRLWLVAILTVVIASAIWWCSSPLLYRVHWDSPIYLYQAKRFADTPMLRSYAVHANAVALQVDGHWPSEEEYSESYWRFTRLGHIALIGTIADFYGATLKTVAAARWLSTALVCLSFLLAAGLAVSLNRLWPRSASGIFSGAGVLLTAACYFSSDITAYLSRSIVSEVPATTAVASSALVMTFAVRTGSSVLATFAGVLAFLAYFFRVESVWTCIAFFTLLMASSRSLEVRLPARLLVMAGVGALIPFLSYAWIFHPLTDPRLFIAFARNQPGNSDGVSPWLSLSASGGLLWLGVFLAALLAWNRGLCKFLMMWILLCVLPAVPHLLRDAPVQARMFSTTLPALTALSCLGWSTAIYCSRYRYQVATTAFAVCLILGCTSIEPVYERLRGLSGLWRLQWIRAVIAPAHYEGKTYDVESLLQIAQSLNTFPQAEILVYESGDIRQEDLNIVRFFGPGYHPLDDLALVPDPTNPVPCASRALRFDIERMVFCTAGDQSDLTALRGRVVVSLGRRESKASRLEKWNQLKGMRSLTFGEFELTELVPP